MLDYIHHKQIRHLLLKCSIFAFLKPTFLSCNTTWVAIDTRGIILGLQSLRNPVPYYYTNRGFGTFVLSLRAVRSVKCRKFRFHSLALGQEPHVQRVAWRLYHFGYRSAKHLEPRRHVCAVRENLDYVQPAVIGFF